MNIKKLPRRYQKLNKKKERIKKGKQKYLYHLNVILKNIGCDTINSNSSEITVKTIWEKV